MKYIACFFALGVFLGSSFLLEMPVMVSLGIVAIILITTFYLHNQKLQIAFLYFSFFFVGSAYVSQSLSDMSHIVGKRVGNVKIVSVPKLSQSGKVYFCDGIVETGDKLLVFISSKVDYTSIPKVNDVVETDVDVNKPKDFIRSLLHGYNGTLFLNRNSFVLSNYNFEIQQDALKRLIHKFENARNYFLSIFKSFGLEGDEYAVVAAMSLGDKEFLTDNLRVTYSRSGASHILALSGMHIGIIYFLLLFLFRKIISFFIFSPEYFYLKYPNNRFLRKLTSFFIDYRLLSAITSISVLIVVWMYVFLVGFPMSVIRAATMLTIYSVARFFCRNSNSFTVLSLTLFLVLLVSPLSIFDVGLQMSFAAVLGITLFYIPLRDSLSKLFPVLSKDLKNNTNGDHLFSSALCFRFFKNGITWLWSCSSISISAQILVIPLISYYFGNIACYGVITNLVVSILASLIVVLSLAVLTFASISIIFIPKFLALILSSVVYLQNQFIYWESSLYGAYCEIRFSLIDLFVYYMFLIIVCYVIYIWHNKKIQLFY